MFQILVFEEGEGFRDLKANSLWDYCDEPFDVLFYLIGNLFSSFNCFIVIVKVAAKKGKSKMVVFLNFNFGYDFDDNFFFFLDFNDFAKP